MRELKEVIVRELRFPLDRLKLVKGGSPLDDDAQTAALADGGVADQATMHAHDHLVLHLYGLRVIPRPVQALHC